MQTILVQVTLHCGDYGPELWNNDEQTHVTTTPIVLMFSPPPNEGDTIEGVGLRGVLTHEQRHVVWKPYMYLIELARSFRVTERRYVSVPETRALHLRVTLAVVR